jgi:CIC family chloride channel protein
MGALAWLRHRGSIVLDRLGITENTFMVMLALAIGILARLGNYVFCQPPQHSLS